MQKVKTDTNGMSDTDMEWAKTDYGFRWFYLLFPFIPSWLIAKSIVLLFWHMACSFFEGDESPFASVYTEDRSNRIAFLILVLFLIAFFVYLYVKSQ